ncbi:MAG: hypothetical protein K6F17_06640 [Lachnospiraceae bacterium]|nr:hypothetical protein [Lachnospiraceae bacterium]
MLRFIRDIIDESLIRLRYHKRLWFELVIGIILIIGLKDYAPFFMYLGSLFMTLLNLKNILLIVPLTDKELHSRSIAVATVYTIWWGMIRVISMIVWREYSIYSFLFLFLVLLVIWSMCIEAALEYSTVRKTLKHRGLDRVIGFVFGCTPGGHCLLCLFARVINQIGIPLEYWANQDSGFLRIYRIILCAFALIYTIYVIVRCKPVDEEYSVVKQ